MMTRQTLRMSADAMGAHPAGSLDVKLGDWLEYRIRRDWWNAEVRQLRNTQGVQQALLWYVDGKGKAQPEESPGWVNLSDHQNVRLLQQGGKAWNLPGLLGASVEVIVSLARDENWARHRLRRQDWHHLLLVSKAWRQTVREITFGNADTFIFDSKTLGRLCNYEKDIACACGLKRMWCSGQDLKCTKNQSAHLLRIPVRLRSDYLAAMKSLQAPLRAASAKAICVLCGGRHDCSDADQSVALQIHSVTGPPDTDHALLVDPNDHDGNTLVHAAAKKGLLSFCEQYPDLLRVRNNDGQTPLHLALSNRDDSYQEGQERLLICAKGALEIADRSGDTPLHLAVKLANPLLVTIICDHTSHCNVMKRNSGSLSALDLAQEIRCFKNRATVEGILRRYLPVLRVTDGLEGLHAREIPPGPQRQNEYDKLEAANLDVILALNPSRNLLARLRTLIDGLQVREDPSIPLYFSQDVTADGNTQEAYQWAIRMVATDPVTFNGKGPILLHVCLKSPPCMDRHLGYVQLFAFTMWKDDYIVACRQGVDLSHWQSKDGQL